MMFGALSCLQNIRTLCTQLLNNPKAVASGSSGTEFLRMHHWLPETALFKKMDVFKAQHVLIRWTLVRCFWHTFKNYPLLFTSTWSYSVLTDITLLSLPKLGQSPIIKSKK